MMRKVAGILAVGLITCLALAAGFAQEEADGSQASETARASVVSNSLEVSENGGQAEEEIRIDEWGSVWIGGAEQRSALRHLMERVGEMQFPEIGEVACNGTSPVAVTLVFPSCEVLFKLERIDSQYLERAEISKFRGRSALGEMEFQITIESYLNMQMGIGDLAPSYEGVYLYF